MSYYEYFIAAYPFICFLIINMAILAVVLPNRICDTSSLNKNWIIVSLILGGLMGIKEFYFVSFLIFGMMLSFMCVFYFRYLAKKKHSYQTINTHEQPDFLKRVK